MFSAFGSSIVILNEWLYFFYLMCIKAALKHVVQFKYELPMLGLNYLLNDFLPMYLRSISQAHYVILLRKLSNMHSQEIVHILFYNYWVGKSLFSRCIYKILCITEFCIRIKMKAGVVGQSLKITG